MATISYVDDRQNQREWTVSPPISVLKSIDDYLSQRIPRDVLIIHGGQGDATDNGPGGRARLIEALLCACRNDGRAVVFSGGQPMIAAPVLRQELNSAGYVEGHHYVVLTAIQNLWQELDRDLLTSSKITPEWMISSVKRRHAAPVLLSLALLSQAALIAAEPPQLGEDAIAILGGSDAVSLLRQRCAPPSANALFSPQPWQVSLGNRSAGEVLTAMEQEWPSGGPADDGVEDLVKAIYYDPAALNASTVSRAYRDLRRVLARSQELQQ